MIEVFHNILVPPAPQIFRRPEPAIDGPAQRIIPGSGAMRDLSAEAGLESVQPRHGMIRIAGGRYAEEIVNGAAGRLGGAHQRSFPLARLHRGDQWRTGETRTGGRGGPGRRPRLQYRNAGDGGGRGR